MEPERITKKMVCRYLMAMTYNKDKSILKREFDPNSLRNHFYMICSELTKKYKTQIYSFSSVYVSNIEWYISHYIGNKKQYDFPNEEPPISFTKGITLTYIDNYDALLIVNYNPEIEISPGIKGRLSCEKVRIKMNDNTEDGSYMWGDTLEMTNDIVELFNWCPKIIGDLCTHNDIGAEKLLQIIKYQN